MVVEASVVGKEKQVLEVEVIEGVEVAVEVIEDWVGDALDLEMVIEEVDLVGVEVMVCQGKWKYENEYK